MLSSCRPTFLYPIGGQVGHSVAKALTARSVPFVYSSGNTGRKSGDVLHDRLVLKKPFKYEELVETLTRLSWLAGGHRELL